MHVGLRATPTCAYEPRAQDTAQSEKDNKDTNEAKPSGYVERTTLLVVPIELCPTT